MKHIVSITLLLFAILPSGQESVPVRNEPHHHFKFENEYVRVFDVVVPARDATLYHLHSNDYVFVNLSNVKLKAQVLGRDEVELPVTIGQTVFTKGPITHRVANPDVTPFRNITIEILKSPHMADTTESSASGLSVVTENDRVRIERLVLEPGESTGMHKYPLMGLTVAVTGGKMAVRSEGEPEQTSKSQPGDFKWNGAGRTCSIKNIGRSRLELVEVEWK